MDETSIGAQGRLLFFQLRIYGGLGMAYKHLSCVGFKKNLVLFDTGSRICFFLGQKCDY